jgi:preprotein translocase subunit SecG
MVILDDQLIRGGVLMSMLDTISGNIVGWTGFDDALAQLTQIDFIILFFAVFFIFGCLHDTFDMKYHERYRHRLWKAHVKNEDLRDELEYIYDRAEFLERVLADLGIDMKDYEDEVTETEEVE